MTGNLRGKPAMIVHGRGERIIPVNHTSRPYFGTNKMVEGAASRLSYIEVLNAQHFETFIGRSPGYDTRFIPMHYYDKQALNLMWNHLRNGAALPPSQVIRTTPRGGTPGRRRRSRRVICRRFIGTSRGRRDQLQRRQQHGADPELISPLSLQTAVSLRPAVFFAGRRRGVDVARSQRVVALACTAQFPCCGFRSAVLLSPIPHG